MPQETMACTPSQLINLSPCLGCVSQKQMWAVMLDVLRYEYQQDARTEISLKEVLKDSACWVCTSKKQRLGPTPSCPTVRAVH